MSLSTLGKSFLAFATASLAVGALAPVAGAHTPGRGVTPGSRLFVPVPSKGVFFSRKYSCWAEETSRTPGCWRTWSCNPRPFGLPAGTPAQVQELVRVTMLEARARPMCRAPVLVVYDIPGRDCAQYSAGGALDEADYEAWISAFAAGIGSSSAVVILEPDALGNLPSPTVGARRPSIRSPTRNGLPNSSTPLLLSKPSPGRPFT